MPTIKGVMKRIQMTFPERYQIYFLVNLFERVANEQDKIYAQKHGFQKLREKNSGYRRKITIQDDMEDSDSMSDEKGQPSKYHGGKRIELKRLQDVSNIETPKNTRRNIHKNKKKKDVSPEYQHVREGNVSQHRRRI